MAANFNDLLSIPADDIERPPLLPVGDYIGQVTKIEEHTSAKGNPAVRVEAKLLEPGTNVDPSAFDDPKVAARVAKMTGRVDFYLTEDARWRLSEFLIAVHDAAGSGKSLKELLLGLPEKKVLVSVIHVDSKDGTKIAVFDNMSALPT
jgi:hypothetical protein